MVTTLARPPRRDALPENQDYRDDGCNYHPSCLTCPFEKCRYDLRGGERISNMARNAEILAMYAANVDPDEITIRCNISRRTLYRVVAAAREAR